MQSERGFERGVSCVASRHRTTFGRGGLRHALGCTSDHPRQALLSTSRAVIQVTAREVISRCCEINEHGAGGRTSFGLPSITFRRTTMITTTRRRRGIIATAAFGARRNRGRRHRAERVWRQTARSPSTARVPDAGTTELPDPFGNVKELGPLNSNTTKIGVIHSAAVPTLDTTNPNGQVDLRRAWLDTERDTGTEPRLAVLRVGARRQQRQRLHRLRVHAERRARRAVPTTRPPRPSSSPAATRGRTARPATS